MIEAKNLKKVYKTKKGVVVNALDNVSVKLPDTEIHISVSYSRNITFLRN